MIAALAAGLELEEAVRRANAAAALSVTRAGPATAPTLSELESFLASEDRRAEAPLIVARDPKPTSVERRPEPC
jgi:bifunctional ADP-heptose synthase (sugar kinase/adenylyltransferase)